MATGANLSVALIGLGEVGQALAADLRKAGVEAISAFDIAFARADSAQAQAAKALGLTVAASAPEAARRATLAISAVTAGSALDAARATAPGLLGGTMYLDVNSVAPRTKQEAAEIVEKAGGRYVEAAVMSPIHPKGIGTPILLGGAHTEAFIEIGVPLGFNARKYADRIGAASSVKMCRSVMIKGLEAMVIESFTTARAYGVEAAVLASLTETFPGIDWERQGAYFFQRVIQHGRRRAEEMGEAAQTVREAGLEPWSAAGTAQRQAWMADLADAGALGEREAARADWRADADRILAALALPR